MQMSFRVMSVAMAMVGFAGASSLAPGGAPGNPADTYQTNGDGSSAGVSLTDGASSYSTSTWDVFAPEEASGGAGVNVVGLPGPRAVGGLPGGTGGFSGSPGSVGSSGSSGSPIGSVGGGGDLTGPGERGSIGKGALGSPAVNTTPEPSSLVPLCALMLVGLARRRQLCALLARTRQ